jgi:glycine/D-amino acid oxidase-like deaminating enzyme
MGSTGRNAGLMVQGPNQAYHDAIEQYGHEEARAIYQATVDNHRLVLDLIEREGIDAGFTTTGIVSLAVDEEEAALLQATARALQADGFPAEWLDREGAIEVLGTTIGPQFAGALLRPGQGTVHSARYTCGVALAAARYGARFALSTTVQAIEQAPGSAGWQIRTSRGTLTAEHVVNALNAWSGDLFPELAPLITPTRGHLVLTAPVDFTLLPWSTNYSYEYGRQIETGQLLFGGLRHTRPDMDKGYMPPPGANEPGVVPELVAALIDYLPTIFPAAAGVPMVHHWSGVMAFTPDLTPLVGPWPGRKGLWFMAGFSGHGMPYSQIIPCAFAARIAGVNGPAIPASFDPARFY